VAREDVEMRTRRGSSKARESDGGKGTDADDDENTAKRPEKSQKGPPPGKEAGDASSGSRETPTAAPAGKSDSTLSGGRSLPDGNEPGSPARGTQDGIPTQGDDSGPTVQGTKPSERGRTAERQNATKRHRGERLNDEVVVQDEDDDDEATLRELERMQEAIRRRIASKRTTLPARLQATNRPEDSDEEDDEEKSDDARGGRSFAYREVMVVVKILFTCISKPKKERRFMELLKGGMSDLQNPCGPWKERAKLLRSRAEYDQMLSEIEAGGTTSHVCRGLLGECACLYIVSRNMLSPLSLRDLLVYSTAESFKDAGTITKNMLKDAEVSSDISSRLRDKWRRGEFIDEKWNRLEESHVTGEAFATSQQFYRAMRCEPHGGNEEKVSDWIGSQLGTIMPGESASQVLNSALSHVLRKQPSDGGRNTMVGSKNNTKPMRCLECGKTGHRAHECRGPKHPQYRQSDRYFLVNGISSGSIKAPN